jgi:hypothetical protein
MKSGKRMPRLLPSSRKIPVNEMAESSSDKWEYEGKFARRFGFAQQLELPIPLPSTTTKQQEAANWAAQMKTPVAS